MARSATRSPTCEPQATVETTRNSPLKHKMEASMWQHPYVNICKRAGVGNTWRKIKREGDALFVMDKSVRAWTVQVRGLVPATNYIRFPKGDKKSLDLSGRFLYLQLSPAKSKNFKIHVEINTTNKFLLRFSISNMHKSVKVRGHLTQIPFQPANRQWMVLALDLPSLIATHGPDGFDASHYLSLRSLQICATMKIRHVFTSDNAYDAATVPKELALPVKSGHSEKWEELYGWRWKPAAPVKENIAVLSPNISRSPQAKEKTLISKHRSNRRSAEKDAEASPSQRRHFGTKSALRSTTAKADEAQLALDRAAQVLEREGKLRTTPSKRIKPSFRSTNSRSIKKSDGNGRFQSVRQDLKDANSILRRAGLSNSANEEEDRYDSSEIMHDSVFEDSIQDDLVSEYQNLSKHLTEKGNQNIVASTGIDSSHAVEKAVAGSTKPSTLRPDPIMSLNALVGLTGTTPNSMLWSADGTFMIFTCSSIIAIMNVPAQQQSEDQDRLPLRQTLLQGHTNEVTSIVLNHAGNLLASSQKGKFPMVRLWKIEEAVSKTSPPSGSCVAILTAHASDITSLTFSWDDHLLCAAGKDQHSRVQLVVWDVTSSNNESEKKTYSKGVDNPLGSPFPVVARQISEFEVSRIKFSPYEPRRVISCGRESIRFWRIKKGHLRGMPVILNEYARDTVFTDFAFESSYAPKPFQGAVAKRLFVSTMEGTVVQVNYETRDLECVYRLHDKAIYSIAVNEGFCVTGGGDKYLRVWPLDFSDYFLEAEHEGPVMTVAISTDGLRLAVGTSNGTLGTLDVATHSYKTLLRSHTSKIYACTIDPNPNRPEFVTVSADGTIRVWSTTNFEQLFEFDAPSDKAHCLAYRPSNGDNDVHAFACGFESGCIRVFDVPKTKMTHEYQQHDGPVRQILYDPIEGRRLYSAGVDGNICVYDVFREYQPVKMVAADSIPLQVSMAINSSGTLLASVAPDAAYCIIFKADSLMPVRKIGRGGNSSRIKSHTRLDDKSPAKKATSGFHIVTFSPDGKSLLVATTDKRLVRYSVSTGRILSQTPRIHTGTINSIVYSPSGNYILTAGEDRIVKVWEKNLSQGGLPRFQSFVGHSENVNQLSFTVGNEGNIKMISVGDEEGIRIWDFNGVAESSEYVNLDDEEVDNAVEKTNDSNAATKANYRPPIMDALNRIIQRIKRIGHLISMSITRIASALNDAKGDPKSHSVSIDAFRTSIERLEFSINPEDMDAVCKHYSIGSPGLVNTKLFLKDLREVSAGPFHSRLAFQTRKAEGGPTIPSAVLRGVDSLSESKTEQRENPDATFGMSAISMDSTIGSFTGESTSPKEAVNVSLTSMLGYHGIGSGSSRDNVLWHPESAMFGFVSGNALVFEDLVGASEDHTNTRRQNHVFGPKNEIQMLAISPHAKYIAAVEDESREKKQVADAGKIFVWTIDRVERHRLIHDLGRLQSIQFSTNDNYLIAVGSYTSATVMVWEMSTGDIAASYRYPTSASPVDVLCPIVDHEHEQDVRFLSIGRRSIQEWEMTFNMEGERALECNSIFDLPGIDTNNVASEYFTSISIDEDHNGESTVVVGGSSGMCWMFTANRYDVSDTRSRLKLRMTGSWQGLDGTIDHMQCHCASETVVVAGVSPYVQLWSASNELQPTLLKRLRIDGHIISMTWDDSLSDAIVGTDSGSIWGIRRNKEDLNGVPIIRSHRSVVKALESSDNGTLLASAGGDDGTVRVWQTQMLQDILVLQGDANEGACTSVAFSVYDTNLGDKEKRLLAAGYNDGTIRQYNLRNIYVPTKNGTKKNENPEQAVSLLSKRRQPHRAAVSAVAYVVASARFSESPESSHHKSKNVLISGSCNGDVVVNLHDGKVVRELTTPHHKSKITCIERSTFDSSLFLISSNNTCVSIWRCSLSIESPMDVSFQQVSLILLGSKKRKKKVKRAANDPLRPTLACFSPVDSSVVLCTTDQKPSQIAFYCFSTKRFLRTIALPQWHFATSLSAYLSTTSNKVYVAAGLSSGRLYVIDYHSEAVADIDACTENGKINALSFCPNQSALFTSSDSNILYWEL